MPYFFDTVETIPYGVGFQHFGLLHLVWLIIAIGIVTVNCIWYRAMGDVGRRRWRYAAAALLVANELFKTVLLLSTGRYLVDYLPLHLCSINIFLILFHSIRPGKLLGNFLYTVCIPGAMAALIFPSWSALPVTSGMHLHSFTVHINLVMYCAVLAVNGELHAEPAMIPKCLLTLLLMAAVIYPVNCLLDTNFMFLMYADSGNPLYWFEQNWGSHLLGFPVLIAGVMAVMYLPLVVYKKLHK